MKLIRLTNIILTIAIERVNEEEKRGERERERVKNLFGANDRNITLVLGIFTRVRIFMLIDLFDLTSN